MLKKCEWCKQNFLNTKTGTKKFCSVSCRDKYRWWKGKREKFVKKFVPNKCTCLYCGSEFLNTNIRKPSGRKYCDKTCEKRNWRKNNPDKNRVYQERVNEKRKKDPIRYDKYLRKGRELTKTPSEKFRRYRKNAEIRNIDFSLTYDEFNTFWGKNCHYCGSEIKTIGIDRIDNNKGYYKENCVPCCEMCNRMKMKYSVDSFIKKCKEISNHFL